MYVHNSGQVHRVHRLVEGIASISPAKAQHASTCRSLVVLRNLPTTSCGRPRRFSRRAALLNALGKVLDALRFQARSLSLADHEIIDRGALQSPDLTQMPPGTSQESHHVARSVNEAGTTACSVS